MILDPDRLHVADDSAGASGQPGASEGQATVRHRLQQVQIHLVFAQTWVDAIDEWYNV